MTTQEHMDKATLLAKIRTDYAAFEQVLAPLSNKQMTTPGVNDTWTIKDNIAHLASWQRRLITQLHGALNNLDLPDQVLGADDTDPLITEMNERFHQENKDRSLADVQQEFSASVQQIIAYLETMSDEQLNRPRSWLRGDSVLPFIAGNTYEHYQEHSAIIQHWLAVQSR